MKPESLSSCMQQPQDRTPHRAHGRSGSRRMTSTLAGALALVAATASVPATAANECDGHWVRTLATSHAVTRQPILDVDSLRQRLPELEASIRIVLDKDPTLGPVVAEALLAAIRNGSGISERQLRRDEAVRWMAYQPKPGQFDTIAPACLRLQRDYNAFEINLEIAEPAPPAATCMLVASRDCAAANPLITADVRGSSPGARVTLATGGEAAIAVGGPSEYWTVEDPGPALDAIVTVRAAAAPARATRVLRFVMPKICGNLAFLGETTKPMAPTAEAGCEKSVRLDRCAVASVPPAPETPSVAANSCEDTWVVRPFLFGFFPSGDEQQQDVLLHGRLARESFELGNGYGVGGSMERRFGTVVGVEGTAMFGRGTSEYELQNGSLSGSADHDTTFYAFTVGPNFHVLGCGGVDLYLGPFVGYGGFADPNYWVGDHRFVARFDGRFIWGAQLGLDVPFRVDGPWAFHAGVRYFDLSQDTDAGSLAVDPLTVELGLSYRF
jgi:Outer membrane protein beta-barrel domain